MQTLLKRLLLDSVIAVIIFTQITGCTTAAQRDILNDPERYRLFFPTSEHIVTNARLPILSSFERNNPFHHLNTNDLPAVVDLSPIEWSNDYQEHFWLTWEPERGKNYALLAVELNPTQKTKDVILEIQSLGDELLIISEGRQWWTEYGRAWLLVPLTPILVLLLPFSIFKGLRRGGERPFSGCCFVWIADVETGKTVAGESPPGLKLVLPHTKTGEVKAGK